MLKYKRVLLKMSGEVFKGENESGLDGEVLMKMARRVKAVQEMGCEVGIVIGGGNFWRYRDQDHLDLGRVTSDTMGMMATVMNALAFESALKDVGCDVRAMSAFPCEKAMENYVQKRALQHLDKGRIVIFAGGTGSPYFTTDSAAALRALEMKCEVVLKATKVDGVYDKDPMQHDDAVKIDEMTYQEVLEQGLRVMDSTCASLLKDSEVAMLVFDLNQEGSIEDAVKGNKIGTLIIN